MKKPSNEKNFHTQFIKTLHHFPNTRDKYETFCDWLEIAATALHQKCYNIIPKDADYERFEQKYLELIKKYNKEELSLFANLLSITQLALYHSHQDFLGRVYELAEFSNRDRGQFFTPYHVSQMMAKMVLIDIKTPIKEKGYFTMCEPCCGAGGMIIAAAEEVREQGFQPSYHMLFAATDIDRKCFNMSYIQASILDICGYVNHGNTLTMEIWETRPTPAARFIQKMTEEPKRKPEDFTNSQLRLL